MEVNACLKLSRAGDYQTLRSRNEKLDHVHSCATEPRNNRGTAISGCADNALKRVCASFDSDADSNRCPRCGRKTATRWQAAHDVVPFRLRCSSVLRRLHVVACSETQKEISL